MQPAAAGRTAAPTAAADDADAAGGVLAVQPLPHLVPTELLHLMGMQLGCSCCKCDCQGGVLRVALVRQSLLVVVTS